MQQLKISLPDGIRAALEEASAKSGRSLAEEIRERLAWAFKREALADPTRALVGHVEELGALFEPATGYEWSATLKGRQTLALAIQEVLESEAPKHGGAAEGPGDPSTAARMLVRYYRRNLEIREQIVQAYAKKWSIHD
jgi:plasmid stability protein